MNRRWMVSRCRSARARWHFLSGRCTVGVQAYDSPAVFFGGGVGASGLSRTCEMRPVSHVSPQIRASPVLCHRVTGNSSPRRVRHHRPVQWAGASTFKGLARDASEGKGPQRRLDRRLEEVAKAVGGGYCRLQMPLKLALGVRETVAGHRLGALEGGVTSPLPMHLK